MHDFVQNLIVIFLIKIVIAI